jgi:LuxR family maltose regulon positive regulatory protein
MIRRLLQEQLSASPIQSSPTDLFVGELLRLDGLDSPDGVHIRDRASSPQVASGPLTRTEIEILEMANAGLMNREIGQRMGMTEGSVKWYLQQIFNKIGIRRRAGALAHARSLGLLP